MSKAKKIWLITAASLIIAGGVTFVIIMSVIGWDFKMLSTQKYQTNTHNITNDFTSLSIDTTTANITFVPTQDSKCSVVCYEQDKAKHSVSVTDGILTIKLNDARKWYDSIGINFSSPKITVYIPQGDYGNLSIKIVTGNVDIPKDFKFENINIEGTTGQVTSSASVLKNIKIELTTGKINLKNLSADTLDLKTSTGETALTSVTCKNLTSNQTTGDIKLTNVIAEEKFSLTTNTGDITFNDCDAKEIFAKTTTGNVEGALLTEKIFSVETTTGKKDVPQSAKGGKCEISTTTGNVKIRIK